MKYEWEAVPEKAGYKIRVSAGLVDELPVFIHSTGSVCGIYQVPTANPDWSQLSTADCNYWSCGLGVTATKRKAEAILRARQENRALLDSLSQLGLLVEWELGAGHVLQGFWGGHCFAVWETEEGGVEARYASHAPSKFNTDLAYRTTPLELILLIEAAVKLTEPVAYMSGKLQAANRE